jgi:hypothetical protein
VGEDFDLGAGFWSGAGGGGCVGGVGEVVDREDCYGLAVWGGEEVDSMGD